MAFTGRTIGEIYNVMINEKLTKSYLSTLQPSIDNHQTFLNDLASSSKVAIWRCFIWLVAFQTYIFEQIMVNYRNEIDELIDNSYVGSIKWYIAKAKEFQYGDSLVIGDNYNIGYTTIDTDKQICEFAAGEEISGTFYLKVRRKDTDIFSIPEMEAFTEYINQIKFAGTRIEIRNLEPNLAKIYIEIIYNPEYILDDIKTNVYNAINNYIENIEFNSTFYVNKLIDSLQSIEGVIDPQFNWTNSKIYGDSGYQSFTYSYKPTSGYMRIDTDFPLTTTITFTKNS
mgnify:CR=1 FL=1